MEVVMQVVFRLVAIVLMVLFVTATASVAQDIKSGVVNSRDQILNPTISQQTPTSPPADAGKPGPLPCNSKNNPKCEPESKSKPPDGKGN